ncbi:hypothetical protein [Gracilibacillus sp. JCM 18860]|uniref:KS-MAT linker domain-containing protein n=1 Tax=Gracilibacillus sp. JCM 18860 TaxID=1306159 RepID=UPI0006D06E24
MLIPLSARKKDRLLAYAEKLQSFLNQKEQQGQLHQLSISSLAYTLQTGREAMVERVIFQVDSMSELISALRDFAAGKLSANTLQGQKSKEANDGLLEQDKEEVPKEVVSQWVSDGELNKIAKAWVEGTEIDWDALYG